MQRRSIYSGVLIGVLTLSVILAPRPVRAAHDTPAPYRALAAALDECQRVGRGSPHFETPDRQWVEPDHWQERIAGPQQLTQRINGIVQDRIAHRLFSRPAEDEALRQFMSDHFAEAVQGEIRVTVEARLAEARDYLRQGQTEAFEDTLLALVLPPPTGKPNAARLWLNEWQVRRALIHGRPDRALAVVMQLYHALERPAGP